MTALLRLLLATSLLLCATTGFAGGKGASSDAPAWTDEPPVLARMLEDGYRAERSRLTALAAARYCGAARFGSIEAQFQLGRLLLKNRRLADQPDNAVNLLALAARQGHEGAQELLSAGRASPADIGNDLPECLFSGDAGALADSGAVVPFEVVERFIASLSAERRRHARLIQRLAPRYNVDPRLALAIVRAESNFNANALSPKNAQGLIQLTADTAARCGVRNAMDPEQNIRGGLAYLNWLLKRFGGDVTMTAAAYNAGEGAVERHGGVPPYDETQEYVRRILAFYRATQHEQPELQASATHRAHES